MSARQHGPTAEPIGPEQNEQRDNRNVGGVDPRLMSGNQQISQRGNQDAAITLRRVVHIARVSALHERIVRHIAVHFAIEAGAWKTVRARGQIRRHREILAGEEQGGPVSSAIVVNRQELPEQNNSQGEQPPIWRKPAAMRRRWAASFCAGMQHQAV